DYQQNTFVTIAGPLTATGSSNTGGGSLQTIGNLVDTNGNTVNVNPVSDIDIVTGTDGKNFLVGSTANRLFTIDLSQIPQTPVLGRTQNVVANVVQLSSLTSDMAAGSFIKVTGSYTPGTRPGQATATPTPAPTQAPTQGGTTYQAENAVLGGGTS